MFAVANAGRCYFRPILRTRVPAAIAPGSGVRQRRSIAALGLTEAVSHSANVIAQLAEDNAAAVAAATTAAAGVATTAVAVDAVAPGGRGTGPFDFLADVFEAILKVLNGTLEAAHVPYSYGFAIILLTIMVKALTFPLSQKQVQSTVAMQALQPSVKELQAKYAGDPETLQLETARLYKDAGVNPLAGCLPTLATIPVFIGLYKSLSNAAEDGLLQADFFWIPSLAGPTTIAARASGGGLEWLFPFVDGHPPIGWSQAIAYLVMPLLLVISQYASQKIMQPPQAEGAAAEAAASSNAVLKFLPLMIGWFSLNVPSGLTLYWFVNNILSTSQQVYLKANAQVNIPKPAAEASSSATFIRPKEERVKNTSGASFQSGVTIDVEATNVTVGAASSNGSASKQDSRGKGGDKFRARKAREAAAKAAEQAQSPSQENMQ